MPFLCFPEFMLTMAAVSFDFTGKRALVTGGGRGESYLCLNWWWNWHSYTSTCSRGVFCMHTYNVFWIHTILIAEMCKEIEPLMSSPRSMQLNMQSTCVQPIYCPAKFYSHFFLSWSILKCVYCGKYWHLLTVINIQIVYELLEFIVPLTISFAFLYVRSSNLDIVKKLMVVLLSN